MGCLRVGISLRSPPRPHSVRAAGEVTRLAREAVVQAGNSARGRRRPVELGARRPAVRGDWTTPVGIDPFTISWPEKLEVLWSLVDAASRLNVHAHSGLRCSVS